MTPYDLEMLQCCFSAALQKNSANRHAETSAHLQHLYSQLQEGRISPDVQLKLLMVAQALSTQNKTEASKLMTALSAQHWEEHKHWIMAVKRLL
jgi:hypothetical protein